MIKLLQEVNMKHVFLINSFTVRDDLNKIIHNIKTYCEKENISYEIEQDNKVLEYYNTYNFIFYFLNQFSHRTIQPFGIIFSN